MALPDVLIALTALHRNDAAIVLAAGG